MPAYTWQLVENTDIQTITELYATLPENNNYPAANQYGFIQPLLTVFFSGHDYVFSILYADNTPVFILPLVRYQCRKFIFSWTEVGFPFHKHVNLCRLPDELIVRTDLQQALCTLLAKRFSAWSRFAVRDIQAEAPAWEYAGDVAWFDVRQGVDNACSKKHLRNVRRLGSKLHENAQNISFCLHRGDVMAALGQFAELELSSWKGHDGVAILNNPATQAFYQQLAADGMRENMLVAQLWADERLIAGAIGFYLGNTLYIHKISYDDAYAQYAPGNLLVLQILQAAAEQMVETLNLVTSPLWAQRWHPQVSALYNWVYYPANLRGMCLKIAVYGWRKIKPGLKRLLRINA
jgi:hypothetical protein